MAPPLGPRIVSLLPAATEIVYALGAGERLVGVSHECDHPPAALKLPRVSRPRIDPTASSAAIDADVKRISHAKESIYQLDADLLKRLAPDIVLTQVLCDVCAVTPNDVNAALKGLKRQPQIITLDANSLEGVLSDVRTVGKALQLEEEAKLLLFKQWRLTKEIRNQVQDLEPPKVAIIDWVEPLMFAGNWIPDLARMANGNYSLVKEGNPSRWGSWEELEDYEPDVILAAPCGRSTDVTRDELGHAMASYAPGDLAALDAGRVFMADGHHFFNRAGPRLIYSAALMARAFHGDQVPRLPDLLEKELVALPAR